VSDAKVTFASLHSLVAPVGCEQTFGFACPRRAGTRCEGLIIAGRTTLKRDPQGKNGGIAQWDWDGNREAPTFSPSINCGHCGWHGHVERGRCVSTSRQEEPEPIA
jgi:hypothetical protein